MKRMKYPDRYQLKNILCLEEKKEKKKKHLMKKIYLYILVIEKRNLQKILRATNLKKRQKGTKGKVILKVYCI